jgi:hypothetical protein
VIQYHRAQKKNSTKMLNQNCSTDKRFRGLIHGEVKQDPSNGTFHRLPVKSFYSWKKKLCRPERVKETNGAGLLVSDGQDDLMSLERREWYDLGVLSLDMVLAHLLLGAVDQNLSRVNT